MEFKDNNVNTIFDVPQKSILPLIYDLELTEEKICDFLNIENEQAFNYNPFNIEKGFNTTYWTDHEYLNFPGPFYTCETDTCGTGQIAPNNVLFDESALEYVMIQPRTQKELLGLYNAASIECFGGYSCNGNEYWTVDKVKNWWKNRQDVLYCLENQAGLKAQNSNQNIRYKIYLETEAKKDLKKYCYFLEHGKYPLNPNILLPDL